jgi:N-formylglutamate amidohydrolase
MTSSDTPGAAFAAFEHTAPVRPSSVLLASPHSGRYYPADLTATARLDAIALRRSEDAFVDQLIASGPGLGLGLFTATHARAYVDVNRDPADWDPALFHDAPYRTGKPSERVQAGLGVVPRVVGIGLDIYPRRMCFAEGAARIAQVHAPYHAGLAAVLTEMRARHGHAILLDWHSMPSGAVSALKSMRGYSRPRIVLGDCHGRACAPQVTEAVLLAFERRGYAVSVNVPYAGGYTTQQYGKPMLGVHAVQIEIDRSLYMDELRIQPHGGYAGLHQAMSAVLAELAQTLPALELGNAPPVSLPLAAE